MLQTVVCPNIGHSIIHHFDEGAAVWGQAITPSIAHLVQVHHEVAIDYTRVRPGIVFEVNRGVAMLPHVTGPSTFRLHAEAAAFRHAVGRPSTAVDVVVHCEVSAGCALKLWGRVTAEDPAQKWGTPGRADRDTTATIPVIFAVTFWEISRAVDTRLDQLMREAAEKDRRIGELESKVALAMCAQ
ncbi:hypothetical protein ACQZ6F_32130 [Rhizobium sp. A22-96]